MNKNNCFGEFTKLKIFDPTPHIAFKPVKKIKVGEQLLGPDNNPRTVTNTCKGRGLLYKVHQTNGDSYVVNDQHILSLCYFDMAKKVYDFFDVTLLEFMHSEKYRRKWMGYSVHAFRSGVGHFGKAVEYGVYDIKKMSYLTFVNVGEEKYYGVEVDGDKKILLRDNTVVHCSIIQ